MSAVFHNKREVSSFEPWILATAFIRIPETGTAAYAPNPGITPFRYVHIKPWEPKRVCYPQTRVSAAFHRQLWLFHVLSRQKTDQRLFCGCSIRLRKKKVQRLILPFQLKQHGKQTLTNSVRSKLIYRNQMDFIFPALPIKL